MAKAICQPPAMQIDPKKSYTAHFDTTKGTIDDQSVRQRSADHGQQLRLSGARRLLRRRELSPRHQRLHDSGRRPDRDGARRPRLQVERRSGRAATASRQPRHPEHGERREEHQRLAVLHHPHARRRTSTASTPSLAKWLTQPAWMSSTPSVRATRSIGHHHREVSR